jgi:alkanesulfonate monooxygenase SsuD/methylene tetrahydromethanopterin reductase-like flavin-dependent oxidoreductase (luciferase family)
MCVYTTVRIEDDAATAEAVTADFLKKYYGGGVNFRGLMGLGAPDAVIETLKRFESAGVTDLCIRFAGTDQLPQLERFIRDVAPHFG